MFATQNSPCCRSIRRSQERGSPFVRKMKKCMLCAGHRLALLLVMPRSLLVGANDVYVCVYMFSGLGCFTGFKRCSCYIQDDSQWCYYVSRTCREGAWTALVRQHIDQSQKFFLLVYSHRPHASYLFAHITHTCDRLACTRRTCELARYPLKLIFATRRFWLAVSRCCSSDSRRSLCPNRLHRRFSLFVVANQCG